MVMFCGHIFNIFVRNKSLLIKSRHFLGKSGYFGEDIVKYQLGWHGIRLSLNTESTGQTGWLLCMVSLTILSHTTHANPL